MRGRRASGKIGSALLLLLAVPVLLAQPAHAHGGIAAFEVRSAEGRGRQVHVELLLTYENDGEPAESGFVTATPVAPDGRTLPPVELVRAEDGIYVLDTEVDADGAWRFRLTSRFPPGSTEVTVEVDGSAPPADAGEERPAPAPASEPSGDRFGLGSWVYSLLGVGGVLLGVLLVGLATREHRRRQAEADGADPA
jgi:hypothetical protein